MLRDGAGFDRDTLASASRLMMRARRVVEGVRTGAHRSPLHGASVEFAEHKEYTPGDDIRKIDWKAFGRSDKYYVKRFEEETNLLAWLLVDRSASMGYGERQRSKMSLLERLGWGRRGTLPSTAGDDEGVQTKLEYATLLAASLAYLLVGQGDAVGLYTFGEGDPGLLPPRSRTAHLQTLMSSLANLEPAGQGHIANALEHFAPRVRRRGAIILISDLLEDPEEVLDTMKVLRSHRNDVMVLHVLHPDELEFPYDDVSRFEDPEDPEASLVADPREVREGYLAEMEKYLERVRTRCFESQIDYMRMDMRQSVALGLASFVARRTGGRSSAGGGS